MPKKLKSGAKTDGMAAPDFAAPNHATSNGTDSAEMGRTDSLAV
jgi:hypothetical protein